MKKIWQIIETNNENIEKISKEYNISTMLASLLVNRKVPENKINTFLNPTRNDFYSPLLMKDMKRAVDRLVKAIKEQEKIIIYGDYDVDGITSIAVLKQYLEERGLVTDYYIPNRLEEGYGLNKEAIEKISKQGYKLMITVDCGISSAEEIEYAKELGIETIVTDHHEPPEQIPNTIAVINPKRKDCEYPCKVLAGVGVVFKFIQAINIEFKLEEKEFLKYLDLVCIGTISDIVPLLDENRTITNLGMKLLKMTNNIGIKAILKQCGYKEINGATVSFGIAPRINACGRMGYEKDGIELFLSKNINDVEEIAKKLGEYNNKRQEVERKIFEEAKEKVVLDEKAIVLGEENWNHGVIGIVASKLVQEFYKPTVLLCFEEGIGKGSGRSIHGVDLHNILQNTTKYLEHYGGHEMAVGLSLKKENFSDFKKAFQNIIEEMNISDAEPTIFIDNNITLREISVELINEIKKLEPFGEANELPKFMIKNIKIDSIRTLSEGKHIKLTLKEENNIIDAIGFNIGNIIDEYKLGDKVDLVANLEINNFRDEEKVQLNIKDIIHSV